MADGVELFITVLVGSGVLVGSPAGAEVSVGNAADVSAIAVRISASDGVGGELEHPYSTIVKTKDNNKI